MKQRSIAGNLVGGIGLGCMGMSYAYGPSDDNESLRVLDRAIELGCNFWDSADMYGAGNNELLLAKALKKHRSQVFLATKFGNVYDRAMTSHQDQVEDNVPAIVDGTPEYLQKCIDLSLKRLEVEVIDLYYLHRVDPLVPIEETVGAMGEQVRQGKVRYLGLSEASAETLRRAMKVHPITALQSEFSLWTRGVEQEILPTCRELGVTFVPFSPLGRGFLTGTIRRLDDLPEQDWRRSNPRFQRENLLKNMENVRYIQRIADRHQATPAQIALAWVLSRGEDMVPIPGTKRIQYLEQNLEAGRIQLREEDFQELERIQAYGERYPEVSRRYIQE